MEAKPATAASSSRREPQQATERPEPFDAGDPEAVAARNKSLKGREARIDNGLKLVLGHPDSRAWLLALIEETKPFQEAFTGNSATFYNCGTQSIGKRLMAKLLEEEYRDKYFLMLKEKDNV